MNHRLRIFSTLAIAFFCFTVFAYAQQTTTSQTVQGQVSTEEKVRSGEVVSVDGNDLYIRMESGEVKHFIVPPGAKFNVDGKEVGVADLTPGTKLSQTIKTTTTPQTVRTTTSIKGTVWAVNAPSSIILTLDDGTNRQYHIPPDQKFNVNGEQMDAFALRKGMKVDATAVKETPEEVVSQERGAVSGEAPKPMEEAAATPPPPVQAEPAAPTVPEVKTPEPIPAETKAKLPQTASPLPFLLLLGGLSVLGGSALGRNRS